MTHAEALQRIYTLFRSYPPVFRRPGMVLQTAYFMGFEGTRIRLSRDTAEYWAYKAGQDNRKEKAA